MASSVPVAWLSFSRSISNVINLIQLISIPGIAELMLNLLKSNADQFRVNVIKIMTII